MHSLLRPFIFHFMVNCWYWIDGNGSWPTAAKNLVQRWLIYDTKGGIFMRLLPKKGLYDSGRVLFLPIDSIIPNPSQPRSIFSQPDLDELADSIRALGVLQPLTVRRQDGQWELVAGERRLRAAKLAGLEQVPCLSILADNQSSSLLVPVQCEYYALEGLSDLLATIRLIKRGLNPTLALEGVLLTMFDGRTNLSLQVAEEVKRYFPGQVFATVIPRNVRLSEAPSHGKPISAYDRSSRGAEAYRLLAQEVAEK